MLLIIKLALLAAQAQTAQPLKIHVVVALCDNQHQGIVPVKPRLGNGEGPDNNLYWGALYGLRTHFKRSPGWKLLTTEKPKSGAVLERVLFRHQQGSRSVYLLAEAYRGSQIRKAIEDFLLMAAGREEREYKVGGSVMKFGSRAGLVAFVGHNGLMDFELDSFPSHQAESGRRQAIVLACVSRDYFKEPLKKAGADPLLWTTGLMAAEAYTLRAALEGWMKGEKPGSIRLRAAQEYSKYQKCGIEAAKNLLVTGME